ncbi:unnamed protein product [marine sediment metagenome]|uniref:Uncharacterized protein n=1 Tax=marine sediment metagenome TaxID=412755 RepID=X1STZ0_9ZZZZ
MGIVPISEMWSKGRWIVFEDIMGDLHDCTGDVIRDGKYLLLNNREDGKRLEIPREFIIWEETI